MTVDDRTRYNLHRKLEEVLGEEEADTLMAHLSPTTWLDVATKAERRTLETSLRAEMHVGFAELRAEVAGVRTELADSTTRIIKWMVTFAAAWSTLLITAVSLIP